MLIMINNWKKTVLRSLIVLALIIAFAAVVPKITGIFYQQIPALSGWSQEEHPSGNPMRVESEPQPEQNASKFNQLLDQFVFKVQNFYSRE